MSSKWPEKQGLILDQYVAFIFIKILNKCNHTLNNYSDICLPLEIFHEKIRKELLVIVINNCQRMIIQLKKKNINSNYLLKNKKSILFQIFENSLKDFFDSLYKSFSSLTPVLTENTLAKKLLTSEAPILLEIIFRYLIFGTSNNTSLIFPKTLDRISHTKITAFAENLIIQISNYISLIFIKDISGDFVIEGYLNQTFIQSIRDLEKFKNLIIVNSYIDYIFSRPKAIYNGYYRLWIIKECGFDYINIYAYRFEEFNELSGFPLLVTLVIEGQDLVLPQLKLLLAWLGKIIIYVFNRFINKVILLVTKSIRESG
uniref:Uncharacterized protein n=1 Tax=Sciadococcus taiwanensis TaxID=3028030 RepID=A0A9Y1I246_9RHOD|nr:hypothetical protein SCTW_078 [Sciadococcus taiwanensis]